MENERLIPAEDFCLHYKVEQQFIHSLAEAGLIEIRTVEMKTFVTENQLPELEKYCRMFYDLDVNVEGIEVVTHLLSRIEQLQSEVNSLRNQLH